MQTKTASQHVLAFRKPSLDRHAYTGGIEKFAEPVVEFQHVHGETKKSKKRKKKINETRSPKPFIRKMSSQGSSILTT